MGKELFKKDDKKYTEEEIEEKYKKGIISLDEYNELVGDKMRDILVSKVEKEYDDYKKLLLELPKEKIIEKSYETAVKQEFIDEVKYMDLCIYEKKALMNREHLLDECYNDWLDYDGRLSEALDNSFEETVTYLTRYYNNQKKQKELDE